MTKPAKCLLDINADFVFFLWGIFLTRSSLLFEVTSPQLSLISPFFLHATH
jgi:hypothetical protein